MRTSFLGAGVSRFVLKPLSRPAEQQRQSHQDHRTEPHDPETPGIIGQRNLAKVHSPRPKHGPGKSHHNRDDRQRLHRCVDAVGDHSQVGIQGGRQHFAFRVQGVQQPQHVVVHVLEIRQRVARKIRSGFKKAYVYVADESVNRYYNNMIANREEIQRGNEEEYDNEAEVEEENASKEEQEIKEVTTNNPEAKEN